MFASFWGLDHVEIYSFLLGGDGRVYEGRGWRIAPPKIHLFQKLHGKCLLIGFIGDYKGKQEFIICKYLFIFKKGTSTIFVLNTAVAYTTLICNKGIMMLLQYIIYQFISLTYCFLGFLINTYSSELFAQNKNIWLNTKIINRKGILRTKLNRR